MTDRFDRLQRSRGVIVAPTALAVNAAMGSSSRCRG